MDNQIALSDLETLQETMSRVQEDGKRYYQTPEGLRVFDNCLLYTSPSPRDATLSRMPSSA